MNIKIALAVVVAGIALTGCAAEAETVDTTPQACIDALDAAEALVHGPVIEQSEDTIVLIGLIPQAFEAGLNADSVSAQNIIDTMDEITAQSDERNVEIDTLVTEYNETSEECRASAGSNS